MADYMYEPLRAQHIRTITLWPGKETVQISVAQKLFSDLMDTSSGPPLGVPKKVWRRIIRRTHHYEALSYCWGDPTPTHCIEVISKDPQTQLRLPAKFPARSRTSAPATLQFPVAENLYVALLHLRGDQPRALWIDAICINQEDQEEKSREISRMGDIYKYASRVLLWLGPERKEEGSTEAMEVLSHLGRQVHYDPTRRMLGRAPSCEIGCKGWFDDNFTLPYNEETWQSIGHLFSRDWFSRVWVWQEVGLAKRSQATISCGNSVVKWKDFAAAVATIGEKTKKGPQKDQERFRKGLSRAGKLVDLGEGRDHSIMGLAHGARSNGCLDPRDRIYALLSLANHGPQLVPEPNYGDSVAKLYTDLAVNVCKIEGSLHILCYCDAQAWDDQLWDNKGRSLPSWVPNWSRPIAYRDRLSGHASSYKGSASFSFSKCEDADQLLVQAVHCGSIKQTTELAGALDTSTAEEWLYSWLTREEWRSDAMTGGYAALGSVLVANLRDRFPENKDWPSIAEAASLLELIAVGGSEPRQAGLDSYLSISEARLSGRKVFTTEQGNVGLAPTLSRSGDEVFALLGSGLLLVLRQSQNQPGTHQIIGTCSLHGFMDLEALLGVLPADYHVEDDDSGEWSYNMWFVDSRTGEKSRRDPRLDKGYFGWRSEERDEDDCIIWENIKTRERTVHDPRYTSVEFLRSIGTDVREIVLI